MPQKQSPDIGVAVLRFPMKLSKAALEKRLEEASRQISNLRKAMGFTHIVPLVSVDGSDMVVKIVPVRVPPTAKTATSRQGWSTRKK